MHEALFLIAVLLSQTKRICTAQSQIHTPVCLHKASQEVGKKLPNSLYYLTYPLTYIMHIIPNYNNITTGQTAAR